MANPKRLPNIHPGEVLLEEFLKPMEVSQNALARPRIWAKFNEWHNFVVYLIKWRPQGGSGLMDPTGTLYG